ncbi:hypothetical protein PENCOP_c007G00549 [Penicillium coprophilum]|uniref:VWFA domain-containing protein n=1 Tax=Penicillium coprophilum TaxID=36646 RepID=A0A1V6ULE2_9EURO|nr:hypothetical protein PENCOP_c007G00549 [Penicillium coprophilum]
MSITVDVQMEKGMVLRELESPSHWVKVSLGRVFSTPATSSTFEPSQASASVILQQNETSVVLGQDFVLLIKADGLDTPCALLETHPTIPNQRALMASLVPKFNLRPANPEVVFVIDRSGSMWDKIPTLKSAFRVMLKSLPVGICFNICSFGNAYSFMWPTSQVYDASSLKEALAFVDTVDAGMGGTEMLQAVHATVQNRHNSKHLNVLILTDGQIFDQDCLFDFVRETAADTTARFFTLGIGKEVSHSLIEGVARAGNGFCQSVTSYEALIRKVVRMLKGALTPHVNDYKLEVAYDTETECEFNFVSETESISDSETKSNEQVGGGDVSMEEKTRTLLQPISLYDENFQEPDLDFNAKKRANEKLPTPSLPRAIQAPYNIPPLYPFIRTNVFLLMDPQLSEKTPKSLKLSATSIDGPLELRIPICNIGTGKTIHQLASRKAMIELEEGHGWLSHAKDENGNNFKHFDVETKFSHIPTARTGGVSGGAPNVYPHMLQARKKTRDPTKQARGFTPRLYGGTSNWDHRTTPMQRMRGSTSVATPPTPTLPKTPLARMYELIQLQTFEGSWMWSNELFDVLECDMSATIMRLATLYASTNRTIEPGFPHGE